MSCLWKFKKLPTVPNDELYSDKSPIPVKIIVVKTRDQSNFLKWLIIVIELKCKMQNNNLKLKILKYHFDKVLLCQDFDLKFLRLLQFTLRILAGYQEIGIFAY